MGVSLRPYQIQAIKDLERILKDNREAVLSICPGGGKTLTAAAFAKKQKRKTLILAHGTNILRTQWVQRMGEYGIEVSTDIDSDSDIVVQLPQSLYKKDLPQFDLVIVDEAHEFYFANMVKTVIKKAKPKKVLLLTGTPSRFIKHGILSTIISADRLVNEGYMSDVYWGLATTKEPIKRSDYLTSGDLKQSKKFTKTEETLENLVESIHKRLIGLNRFKPIVKNFDTFTSKIFTNLEKTMIACNSIEQANQVLRYFEKRNVKCFLSHSKNDINSENIEQFRSDESIKILIVVNRGVLGFDMPDLVNVVDLTCSKNIDRIYQLYARVMRKSEKYNMKFFFKVVPEGEMQLSKFYLQASLCLMREDFISRFNGKNLSSMEILVPKPVKKRKPTQNGLGTGEGEIIKNPVYTPIDQYLYNTVMACEFLTDIYNKQGRTLNEYAYTTLGKIKEVNFGIARPIKQVTEADLLHILKTGEAPESVYG